MQSDKSRELRRKGLLDRDVDITSYLEYVPRMRKGWRFTGVTIYRKRPSNSLGKPWPQAAGRKETAEPRDRY
ncbi:hypothetical protein ACSQ67_023629 [Phaseolus vulgaris]